MSVFIASPEESYKQQPCKCGKRILESYWESITDAECKNTDCTLHSRTRCLTRAERTRVNRKEESMNNEACKTARVEMTLDELRLIGGTLKSVLSNDSVKLQNKISKEIDLLDPPQQPQALEFADKWRQTGRTTAMIKKAIELVLAGDRVLVIAAKVESAKRIEQDIHHKLRIIGFTSPEKVCFTSVADGDLSCLSGAVVLIDHEVWERCPKSLKVLLSLSPTIVNYL